LKLFIINYVSASPTKELNKPYDCTDSGMTGCNDMVVLWAAGLLGMCYDENMGFLIGGDSGFKYAIFEVTLVPISFTFLFAIAFFFKSIR